MTFPEYAAMPIPPSPPKQARRNRPFFIASPDGCWEWQGAMRTSRNRGAVIPLMHVGDEWIAVYALMARCPPGMTVDHLCKNPTCVRPSHLEVVTAEENSRRVYASRTACGRGHEYTIENTYWNNGWRYCRACERIRRQQRREKRDVAQGNGGAAPEREADGRDRESRSATAHRDLVAAEAA